MKKCCTVCCVSKTLLAIGGLNWGLVGIGGFLGSNLNVVNLLLGNWPVVENIVYILVGLAGLKALLSLFGICCPCKGACKMDSKGAACPACGKNPCQCDK